MINVSSFIFKAQAYFRLENSNLLYVLSIKVFLGALGGFHQNIFILMLTNL